MLIEQHRLIEQDHVESQQLAAVQALDRHLTAPLKEPFEQPIEQFDSPGAQPVKMRRTSTPHRYVDNCRDPDDGLPT